MRVEVILYQERRGVVPLVEWFEAMPTRARADCIERLRLLEQFGHALRRPHADFLRDGVYELRARRQGVNYRMLYFFHGTQAVVVSHGLVKQRAAVPSREIDLAVSRMHEFRRDPGAHSFRGER